jgi:hypothetical protein
LAKIEILFKLMLMGENQYYLSDLVRLLGVPKSWIMNLYIKRGPGRGTVAFRPFYRSLDPKIPHRFSDSDVVELRRFFEAKKAYLQAYEKLKKVNRV